MKATAVIVRLHRPLRFMPPAWIEILSRIVFGWFRGVDQLHERRWRRVLRNLFHARDPHPVLTFYPVTDRSGRFHARHMAIEGRIFDNQDHFWEREGFRWWLKTGAVFGHFEASGGQLVFVPNSLSYEDCSDDEMREFHEHAIAFLHTPIALETLWPAVKPEQRQQMLEAALRAPDDEPEDSQ